MRDVHHHIEEKNHSVRIQFRAIVNHSTVQYAVPIHTGWRSLGGAEVAVPIDKSKHDLLNAFTPDLRFISVVYFHSIFGVDGFYLEVWSADNDLCGYPINQWKKSRNRQFKLTLFVSIDCGANRLLSLVHIRHPPPLAHRAVE